MSEQRGYALWLSVLVIALLALATLTLAQTFDAVRPRVDGARTEARDAVAAQSAMARAAFILLTEPIGPRSVVLGAPRELGVASSGGGVELRLDGRLYLYGDGVWIGVQDEAGLIDLNATSEGAVNALLANAGVAPGRARRLAAALGDFVDQDNLVRIGGAERGGYPDGEIVVNGSLPTRWSAIDVLGWRGLEQGVSAQVLGVMTAGDGEGSVNLNTAPRAVLDALFGDRLSGDLARRREQGEIRDLSEISSLINVNANAAGAGIALTPSGVFRVTVLLGDDEGRLRFVERRLLLATEGERPVLWQDERHGAGDAGYFEAHEQPIEALPDPRARPVR
jgi:hypothetical protein